MFTLHFNKCTVFLDSVVCFSFPRWVSTYKKKITSLLWILCTCCSFFHTWNELGKKMVLFQLHFWSFALTLIIYYTSLLIIVKNGKQNLASASWRENRLFCVFDACGEQALTCGYRAIIEKQILIDLSSFLCPFWWECKTA